MPARYIGLISGTSMDAIDVAICQFEPFRLEFARSYPITDDLRSMYSRITANPGTVDLRDIGRLDALFGKTFADTALRALDDAGIAATDIIAIGSHGQTLWHETDTTPAFTWQIGDAHRIAALTGITTVADFRRKDIALGGQGAPLAPIVHRHLFAAAEPRAIVNLGGIANITLLTEKILGHDTGPANALMDEWCLRHTGQPFDRNGQWAQQGNVLEELLSRLAADRYFALPAPKSTGREYFNSAWLEQHLSGNENTVDVQRTLAELTAITVANEIRRTDVKEILVCGGGAKNTFLMDRLAANLPGCAVSDTSRYGLHPDFVEATAFALLAALTLSNLPGNIPGVTGASAEAILGAIHPAG